MTPPFSQLLDPRTCEKGAWPVLLGPIRGARLKDLRHYVPNCGVSWHTVQYTKCVGLCVYPASHRVTLFVCSQSQTALFYTS